MQFAINVHGLIEREGKYLFTKRRLTAKFAPGKWDSPGGSLEFGESPVESVIRETVEETGIQIKVLKPLAVYSRVVPELDKQFISVVYECEYIDGEVILNDEHTKFVWLNLNEVDSIELVDYLRRALGELQKTKSNEKTSCHARRLS